MSCPNNLIELPPLSLQIVISARRGICNCFLPVDLTTPDFFDTTKATLSG
ncbi:hypothetical protein Hanom_Chr17g01544441 [Helianthus anomalus]